MEIVDIEITSAEELEVMVRALSPGARVFVSDVTASSLFEAAVIYRRLQSLVESSQTRWKVEEQRMQALCSATDHYEALDLLEIFLDLVDRDLKAGINMKGLRFGGVREAANDVVTSAHPTTSLAILDSITIEAQRLARVAKALGFGEPGVDLPILTEEDLDWTAAEDVAVHKLEAFDLDKKAVRVEEGLAALHLGEDGVKMKAYRHWALKKEEHATAVLECKISKLRTAISAAKAGPIF